MANGLREPFRVMKMFQNSVNPLQKSTTYTLIMWVDYILCKFYLYKALCAIKIIDS